MDKSILIQKQIRDNADELQNFMRDLSNWEEEMKRKDTEASSDVSQEIPPIRKKTKTNNDCASGSENVSPSSTLPEKISKKISRMDYQAWDKLDVDKICDELDAESSKNSNKKDSKTSSQNSGKKEIVENKISEIVTDKSKILNCNSIAETSVKVPHTDSTKTGGEIIKGKDNRRSWRSKAEYQNQPPIRENECFKDDYWKGKTEEQVKTRGNYFKELGNDFVAEEKWDEAIKMYSNAVNMYPLDSVFYANRALCHLKLQKYEEAQSDCDVALQLNNKYVKAYLRRATALQNQGKYSLAMQDFQDALKYEPNNHSAKEGLKSVEKLKSSSIKPTSYQENSSKVCSSISAKEKLPLSGDSKEAINEVYQGDSVVLKTWISEKDDIRVIKGPVTRPAHLQSTKPLNRVKISEIQSNYKSPLTSNGADEFRKQTLAMDATKNKFSNTDVKQVISQKSQELVNATQKTTQASAKSLKIEEESKPVGSVHTTVEDLKNISASQFPISQQAPAKSPKIEEVKSESVGKVPTNVENLDFITVPQVPISYVGFTNSWSAMKGEPIKLYLYLKKMGGKKLPDICGDSLENIMLSEILDVLVNEFIYRNENVQPYLLGLTSVKRFRALVLFLSEADKAALRKLFAYCLSKKECSEANIIELRRKFEI